MNNVLRDVSIFTMAETTSKKCLVLSVAPVPTDPKKVVEGGGIRAWRLAKGLQAHKVQVEVAIPYNFELDKHEHEGITLSRWEYSEEFKAKMNSFDSVVLLYSRGDLADYVCKHLEDNVQLIVDLYVPIYIEVSARDSADKVTEYNGFQRDLAYWNTAFKRGDLFLYANQNQLLYYLGVLSALGRLNPLTYKENLLVHLPLGTEKLKSDKYVEKIKGQIPGISLKDKVIIWFGSIYPWFEIEQLYAAYKKFVSKNPEYKLLILGGKNPFNNLPDFIKKYEFIFNESKKDGLLNKSIFFQDWVPYEERFDWLRSGDSVIVINKEGIENLVAWRTRTLDIITSQTVIMTNGGDPISEQLDAQKAIIKISSLEENPILEAFEKLKSLTPAQSSEMKSKLNDFRETIDLTKVSKALSEKILAHYMAPDVSLMKKSEVKNQETVETKESLGKRVVGSLRRDGVKVTLKRIISKVRSKI